MRRTVTETDNLLFSALTMNPAALHLDAEYSKGTVFGERIVNSVFTLGLLVGLSVYDTTYGTTLGNLGWDEVRMPAPVFEGDTIYAQTTILSKRESKSRPNMGLVEIESTGFKQDGTVVLKFRRSILVYKRGHEPKRPEPTIKS